MVCNFIKNCGPESNLMEVRTSQLTKVWICMECVNRQYSATIFASCFLRTRYHSVTVFIIIWVSFVILRDTVSVNIDHDFSFMQIVTSIIWCFDFSFMNCPILLFCFLNFSLYFRIFVPDIIIYILCNYMSLKSLVLTLNYMLCIVSQIWLVSCFAVLIEIAGKKVK